ncbi:hypothetical protein MPF19_01945 [Polaribacter sp. Z014]|uniref:hypothetical protein n=1 Tax=unclassified Polaribacter TaxID=196858 RepID=UPI00193C2E92|nr:MULTISPECIES: hypothetical protein [unclassified Polaribacter]MCL7762160.1 hypothetical protein [Polaribacter sp. Z014]QVY64412.1 hypothetical protein JOP69_11600 [Polaribacter sp. Q13]
MKKITLLLISLLVFYSCLNNDNDIPNYTFEYLKIDEAITPASFTFGEQDTITVKYSLPNGCYSFDQVFYESKDSTRTVAVRALVKLDLACTEAIVQEEKSFVVKATQKEDYIFKFYKGKDSIGENIFEEVIVPVN